MQRHRSRRLVQRRRFGTHPERRAQLLGQAHDRAQLELGKSPLFLARQIQQPGHVAGGPRQLVVLEDLGGGVQGVDAPAQLLVDRTLAPAGPLGQLQQLPTAARKPIAEARVRIGEGRRRRPIGHV
jgi:hypothetical protein